VPVAQPSHLLDKESTARVGAARTRIRQIAIGITALAAIGGTALVTSIEASPAVASPARAKPYAGNAWAGVRVNSSGKVVNYFNTFARRAPRITHPSSGVYEIFFPKVPIKDGNSLLVATPDTPSADCTATNADYAGSTRGTVVVVETKDCSNAFADRGFHLLVFG